MLASFAHTARQWADAFFSPTAVSTLAELMDNQFTLPGTSMRVGWDFIIGLVPIAGDVISTVISSYILAAALYHRAAFGTITRMLANILVDFVVGLIPVVGDIFDAHWKANTRNVKLLHGDLQHRFQ